MLLFTIARVFFSPQMDSGERLQADFPPSASLTDVLAKWTDLTAVRPGLQRVCIYMREEVCFLIVLKPACGWHHGVVLQGPSVALHKARACLLALKFRGSSVTIFVFAAKIE